MRKGATYAFYLAVFGIFADHCHAARSRTATHSNQELCALNPRAKVSDTCASYAELDALNDRIRPAVGVLANDTDFFAYYRLNLYNKECPFWSDSDGMCGNIACAVTTLENENDIPAVWRAEELSKLQGPKARHPGRELRRERLRDSQPPLLGQLGEDVGESCVVEHDDDDDERDYCVPEDETPDAKGDYVSLTDNPERFTGYAGTGAHHVWEAIYRENCFSRPQELEPSAHAASAAAQIQKADGLSPLQAKASLDFKQVMKAHEFQQALRSGPPQATPGTTGMELDFEGECVEKRVFYRIISGMHASISTHLCHDYLNQTTGEWGPNLACYRERLHSHPDRISNLYFNYALVLRAIGKLRERCEDYVFCTGDAAEDARTRKLVLELASEVPQGGEALFDERTMFQDTTETGVGLKEDFRARFRNVSRIMDCVGCDKCRLWGKIQTNGLGAALKVLFESGHENESEMPTLRRTELVALVNTLDKISAALEALADFRGMLEDEMGTHFARSLAVNGLPPSTSPAASEQTDPSRDDSSPDDPTTENETTSKEEKEVSPLSEVALVADVMLLVVRAWMRIPGMIGTIALSEGAKLWNRWLGLPPPREQHTWKFAWPDPEGLREQLRDEL